MAKNAAMFPTWVQTIGAIIENDTRIDVLCSKCGARERVDPKRIRLIKGNDYSLINRRCRCRLTDDCDGWNKFHYLHGVMRPLWTEERAMIWMERDWQAEKDAHRWK